MKYLKNAALLLTVLYLIGCVSKNNKPVDSDEGFLSERDQMEQAMEQEFMMTKDPKLGYIPKERLIAALAFEQRQLASRQMGINDITWQERGPNNVAGRTRAFLIDSRDATGNTIFAASVSGGIWKTTNFKSTNPTWTPVNENMGSLAVCALAQDPSNPSTMYAGTGEGWFNVDAVRGNGIWKSIDGGTTWNQLSFTDSSITTHNFDFIQDLVVTKRGTVFATGRPSVYCNTGGVFRSNNGGLSWTRPIGTLPAQVCDSAYNFFGADLEVASNGDVYATTGFYNKGENINKGRIWRSSFAVSDTNVGNGTAAWKDITPTGTWQRIAIATAPTNPAIIYALLQGSGNGIGAIKKSSDTGATWTDLPLPSWCNQGSPNQPDFTNGQAFYDLIVRVDPNDSNTVIIGGIDLFKSKDGGNTWNQITAWAGKCSSYAIIHADQHNVQFLQGNSSQVVASNDGGIWYSQDGGTSWATFTGPNLNGANQTTYSSKNTGYNVTQFYACAIHPTQTNYFLAGCQDNGTQKFTSPGINTTVEASVGGDGGFCHIDQNDGNIQIISFVHNNYYYSTDNGNSFRRLSLNSSGFFINPSDYDKANKVLYSSSGPGQLGLISNFTTTPTFSTTTIPALGIENISAVKVDPTISGGGTVWVAGYDSTGKSSPVIAKLTNANGSATTALSTTLSSAPAGSYVSSIDVDPANSNHLLVTLSNYGIASVYESTDGGNSFNTLDNNSSTSPNLPDIPVRWGMFVPANASVNGTNGGGILLATEIGVYYAQTSAGASTVWTPQSNGLPHVRCDMLKYRPLDNLVAVATHGRGLFTTNLTAIVTGVPTVSNTKNFINYTSANQQQLFIKAGNLNMNTMQVRLFDATGRLVYSSNPKYSDQSIPIAPLPGGSYIIKIYGDKNAQYTRQFVK